jgi:hypothetical protein
MALGARERVTIGTTPAPSAQRRQAAKRAQWASSALVIDVGRGDRGRLRRDIL